MMMRGILNLPPLDKMSITKKRSSLEVRAIITRSQISRFQQGQQFIRIGKHGIGQQKVREILVF